MVNFREKFAQAKQLLEIAPLLAEGLKEQARTKIADVTAAAHDKIETGRAVVEQVRAIAPLVIAMKKEEYKGKLGKLGERFGLSAGQPQQQPGLPSDAEMEAFLKSLGADASAEPESEPEAPAAEPAAAAPANDAKPKKAAAKSRKKSSARKPK